MTREDLIRFWKWRYFSKGTARKDIQLYEKVCEYEFLFADMLFKRDTSTFELIKYNVLANSEVHIDAADVPFELMELVPEKYTYKVKPLNGAAGKFDYKHRRLYVAPDELENESVILHEMIHLYECDVNEQPLYFHDVVCWALYNDLKHRITKLDTIITEYAQIWNQKDVASDEGVHDILFLLKSFDLDIRQGYPLGTVFGYGRQEAFRKYAYKRPRTKTRRNNSVLSAYRKYIREHPLQSGETFPSR